jgi:hypothetical protein
MKCGASLAVALAMAAAGGAGPDEARAEPPPVAAPNAAVPHEPAPFVPLAGDAVQRLRSGNADQIASALDDVRVSGRGGASAVPCIVELLQTGLPLPLTIAAIEALGDTESSASAEVLSWYVRHRDVDVRRAAVGAIAKTRAPNASRVLRAALSDADPAVRGIAASSLGDLKAFDAETDLFAALDRGVSEAAKPIGALCTPAECDRLAAKLGRIPLEVVSSGLSNVLLRPPSEIDDAFKIKLVDRLRDMGTAEVHGFLKDLQSKWPARFSQRVKQAIDAAVAETAASPGTPSPEGSP